MSWVLSVPELVRLSHTHFRCRPPRLYGFRSRQDNLAAEALPVYFIALCTTLYSGYSQFLVLQCFVAWVNVPARALQNVLRANLPTVVGGVDVAPALLLVIMIILWSMLESRWARWRMKAAL